MNVNALYENKLSRVWQLARTRHFAIMTAFRNNYSREENTQRNTELAASIRAFGAGFWVLNGHWVENSGTAYPVESKEESFFISLPKTNNADLTAFVIKQCCRYNQEAAIIKPEPDAPVVLLSQNGDMETIGTFSPDKVAKAYSRIRGTGHTFVFEGAGVRGGWAAHLSADIVRI